MQQQGVFTDVFMPHSEALRAQLKFTSSFWSKENLTDCSEMPLVQGMLKKVTKNKKQIEQFYALLPNGLFIKFDVNDQSKVKSTFQIKSKIVIVQQLENSLGDQCFQLEYFSRKKLFYTKDIKKWIDALLPLCIGKNMISKRYQFHTQINKGNFSKVYLVENTQNNEQFTAKSFLKEDMAKTPKLKDSIISEILVLKKLKHDNIIELIEIHEDASSGRRIVRIIQNEKVNETIILREGRQINYYYTLQVGQIIYNIIQGLNFMHSQDIMHRDLKLENILIPDPSTLDVIIVDFGLATSFTGKQTFKKCGTPGYIAPEVLNIGVYSEKVDIFSAGVICYILQKFICLILDRLTQKPVFPGNNISSILNENTAGRINFNIAEVKRLSDDAQDFMRNALSLQEEQRPSANQCLQHPFLKQFANQMNKKKQNKKIQQKNTTVIQLFFILLSIKQIIYLRLLCQNLLTQPRQGEGL